MQAKEGATRPGPGQVGVVPQRSVLLYTSFFLHIHIYIYIHKSRNCKTEKGVVGGSRERWMLSSDDGWR